MSVKEKHVFPRVLNIDENYCEGGGVLVVLNVYKFTAPANVKYTLNNWTCALWVEAVGGITVPMSLHYSK